MGSDASLNDSITEGAARRQQIIDQVHAKYGQANDQMFAVIVTPNEKSTENNSTIIKELLQWCPISPPQTHRGPFLLRYAKSPRRYFQHDPCRYGVCNALITDHLENTNLFWQIVINCIEAE